MAVGPRVGNTVGRLVGDCKDARRKDMRHSMFARSLLSPLNAKAR
jgi:hypothetical protein